MTKLTQFYSPFMLCDDLFKLLYSEDPFLKEQSSSSYPKYDIIKDKDNKDRSKIVMAVAGLDKDKIKVTSLKNKLSITYSKDNDNKEDKEDKEDLSYIVQHISNRNFKQIFTVPEGREVKIVEGPKISDGLLTITVEAYIPEDCREKEHKIEY